MDVFLLVALLALAIPAAAVAGFFMALQLRTRTRALEERLVRIEARVRDLSAAAPISAPEQELAPDVSPAPTELPAVATSVEEPSTVPPLVEAPLPSPGVVPAVSPSAPKKLFAGLEEQIGTRWAVWVGGLALALGGVFLVRYSIEQGLLGPGARVALGALFAAALIAAGEVLRRRELTAPGASGEAEPGPAATDSSGAGDGAPQDETAQPPTGAGPAAPAAQPPSTPSWTIPSFKDAHVPGVLTAAGTSTAFATVYVAYALYGLIGPLFGFVGLALIALITLFAAALHGPGLAALGLLGALVAPLLVASTDPNIWLLVPYLGFVVFAADAVARLRLWRWLAVAATAGGILWGMLLVAGDGSETAAIMAHILLQTALAGAFLVADPYRGAPEEAPPDWLASGLLLPFAVLAVLNATTPEAAGARPAFAGAAALLMLGLALRFPVFAAGAVWAALIVVATLALWPRTVLRAQDPPTLLPGPLTDLPRPEALETYLAFGLVAALAIAAGSLWRLSRGRNLPLVAAGLFAGAATAGPLLALTCAWARVVKFDASVPFAIAAGALGAGFAVAAVWLRRREGETLDAIRLGVGATASAAAAALALGLTFALDRGMLTVAFALAALGTAHVADRAAIPALRYVVGALGLLVLARLIWDPTLVRGDLGETPVFNWLLWGYGVPALAFFIAARILERGGRDRVIRLLESLALACAGFLVFFEIRHALNAGDPLAATSSHIETGLLTSAGLLFALVLLRVNERRNDIVDHVALLVFSGGSLIVGVFGLVLLENPYLTGEPVVGGAVFNSLLLAYLMPAVLAAALAYRARLTRPWWYQALAAALAFGLQFIYMILEIRRLFQGPQVDLFMTTGESELWAYSAALLVVGIVLLVVGLMRGIRLARLASAGYIVAAVAKVFLVDLSHLEGAMRALSFIGLGLTLVGIGLAYQRLLARRPPASEPTPAS